jgi:putative endonuclease
MTMQRQNLGKSGEDRAVCELQRRGYAILARRYRTRHGEIDIVADDRGTIVFVEVKAREQADCGGAAAAVTIHKQRRLTSMAVDYLARNRVTDRPCRFDVVAIDGQKLTVYTSAFEVEESPGRWR